MPVTPPQLLTPGWQRKDNLGDKTEGTEKHEEKHRIFEKMPETTNKRYKTSFSCVKFSQLVRRKHNKARTKRDFDKNGIRQLKKNRPEK